MSTTITKTNQELTERRQKAIPPGPFNIAPIFAEKAQGAKLWDVEGNEYLDFCGGIGVLNVGHNHPKITAAVQAQTEKFLHTCFHVAMYEEYVQLAERLNELVPIDGECKTALFNSGAEAGENAVKICRKFTNRPAVVGFERGFHGRTLLGMTLTGKVKPYSAGMGPFAPEVYRLPYEAFFHSKQHYSDAEMEKHAKQAIAHLSNYHIEAESIACVMMEPVLGEGGFYPAHPVAIKILRDWCGENGIVFIADEVQTGFGRCGSLFAIERFGIRPDLIAMAKSLAGGMVLSGVTAKAEIMDSVHMGGIGGTYGGNPLSCAAANAVLDVMDEENLPARANDIGEKVAQTFTDLDKTYDFVIDVHGIGAMQAIEVESAEKAGQICAAARDRGLLIMTASGNVIRTLMPLVIKDDELEKGLSALREAFAACA